MANKETYLPAEYQGGLDEARYRELMALQLAKQHIPVGGQMVSGLYVKPSNLQYLSNTVNSALVGSETARAQALRQAVMNKYTADQQRAKEAVVRETAPREQELMGPPAEGERMGIEQIPPNLLKAQRMAEASPFPEVQDLAKALQEKNKNLFDEAAKHSGAESVRQAALAGGDVSKMRPTEWGPLEPQAIPGVGTFVTSRSTQGGQQLQGLQKVPEAPTAKWGREEISAEIKSLRERKAAIGDVSRLQNSLSEAYHLIKSQPINTGAMASQVTGLQSLTRLLGIEPPTNVPVTEYVKGTLVPQLAETLKAIRQTGSQSNAELKVAMERALDIDRDPRALEQMLVHAMRASIFAVNEHNKQVKQVEDISPKADVDPAFAALQRIEYKMGISGDDEKDIFPEAFGGTYNPAKTLTRKTEPKAPRVTPFTPPGQ